MLLFVVSFLMLFTFVVIAMLVSEIEYSENITVLELVCAVREKKQGCLWTIRKNASYLYVAGKNKCKPLNVKGFKTGYRHIWAAVC